MTVAEVTRLKTMLAKEVHAYLARPPSTEIDNAERDICATLSRLMQELLRAEDTWDSRYTWLDGVLPVEIRAASGTLEIRGGSIVVKNDRSFVVPVKAALRPGMAGEDLSSYQIFFGEAGSPGLPYRPGMKLSELRVPVRREEWAYTFAWATG